MPDPAKYVNQQPTAQTPRPPMHSASLLTSLISGCRRSGIDSLQRSPPPDQIVESAAAELPRTAATSSTVAPLESSFERPGSPKGARDSNPRPSRKRRKLHIPHCSRCNITAAAVDHCTLLHADPVALRTTNWAQADSFSPCRSAAPPPKRQDDIRDRLGIGPHEMLPKEDAGPSEEFSIEPW